MLCQVVLVLLVCVCFVGVGWFSSFRGICVHHVEGSYSKGFDAQVSCVLLSYFHFFLVCHVLTRMTHVTHCLSVPSCTPCASASILQNLQMNELGGGGSGR